MHWFTTAEDPETEQEPLLEEYYPCYKSAASSLKTKNRTSRTSVPSRDLQIPWTDKVDTNAILTNFSGLTRQNTLPLDVQKKINSSSNKSSFLVFRLFFQTYNNSSSRHLKLSDLRL